MLLDFGISKITKHTETFTKTDRYTIKYSTPKDFQEVEEDEVEFTITPKFDVRSIGTIIVKLKFRRIAF